MKRDERLKHLSDEIFKIAEEIKEMTKDKDAHKTDFFELVEDEFKGKSYLLPIRTVEVPDEFFDLTDMSYEQFCDSRFPGWDIEHMEKNIVDGKTTFVMKKNPGLMGQVVETDTTITTKSIVEYGPEIDWDTLKMERPDIFDGIVKTVESYEVDEEKFANAVKDEPELLSVLERHMKVKKPSTKLLSRGKKKDAE
jgi:hypothetical protein